MVLGCPFIPTKIWGEPGFTLPTTPQPQADTLELLTCEHAPDDSTHACEEVREGPGRGVEGSAGTPTTTRPSTFPFPTLTCASLSASPSWARARTARRLREAPDRPAAHWRPSHVWSQRTDLSSAPATGGEPGLGPGLQPDSHIPSTLPVSCVLWKRKRGPVLVMNTGDHLDTLSQLNNPSFPSGHQLFRVYQFQLHLVDPLNGGLKRSNSSRPPP